MGTEFHEYEEHAQHLEKLAETLDRKGAEYVALERAALALAFVTIHRHGEFQKFLDVVKQPLTSLELAHLRKLGLK
jgi:hypothetical protein